MKTFSRSEPGIFSRGRAAGREHEFVVVNFRALAVIGFGDDEFESRLNRNCFVSEANIEAALLAKEIGVVNYKFGRVGNAARNKIRQAARAVGNVLSFLEDDDFQIRIEAARATRRAHARGDAADHE